MRAKRALLTVVAVAAAAIMVGCPMTETRLAVSDQTIAFGPGETEKTFEIWNSGDGNLLFELTPTENWIGVSPSIESSTGSDDRVEITVTIPQAKQAFNEGAIEIDSNGGQRRIDVVVTPDFFTEVFNEMDADLENLSLMWTETDSYNFYEAERTENISEFPTNPAGGFILNEIFEDGVDPIEVPLLVGREVMVYGESYDRVYVGSDGYVAVGPEGDATRAGLSVTEHFDAAGVAGFMTNLDPEAGGTVSWRQTIDRMAITWEDVPKPGSGAGETNSFQIELFFDGAIRTTWLEMNADEGVAGLSGGVQPTNFVESDLSEYPTAP